MLTPPQTLGTSHGVYDLNSSQKTQLVDSMVQSQLQLTLFQNPQILRTISSGMTSSTLQPNFLSAVYYDNGDCHILSA